MESYHQLYIISGHGDIITSIHFQGHKSNEAFVNSTLRGDTLLSCALVTMAPPKSFSFVKIYSTILLCCHSNDIYNNIMNVILLLQDV